MITITIPDSRKSILEGITGKQAKVISIHGDEIVIEVDGNKYTGSMDDYVPYEDVQKLKDIFRNGKIAWMSRQLRKVI